MTITIDLGRLTDGGRITNLSGKEKGQQARELFGLDQIDARGETVMVVCPDNLRNISSSFFLGMFSQSVRRLGKDAFLSRYRFQADAEIWAAIMHGIDRSLSSRASLFADAGRRVA